MAVRYTICTYYPDLTRPDTAYDFAVLAASPNGVALVGVNVSEAFGVVEEHPLAKAVTERTFHIVVRRIQGSLHRHDLESCLDLLDRVVESNQSNIQYRSFVDVEGDIAEVVADRVFQRIRPQVEAISPAPAALEVSRFSKEVLRLDEADRKAVTRGMPAYVAYGLRYSATQLVQSATVMYPGLRREGRLHHGGTAFCGRLPQAYGNDGKPMPAPPGMVYVVYTDPDGYVFDWDWIEEDPNHPGYPIDPEIWFTGDPVSPAPEAVLVGVETFAPAKPFDPNLASVSLRGDCIFCYFSEAFAYADRINNDLTVFRSMETKEPTGFKIKNVRRMLEDRKVRLSAPDLAVEVQAFLLASLVRNPDTRVEVYSVLIGAWMRLAGRTEPAKITLARPQQVGDDYPGAPSANLSCMNQTAH